MKKYVLKPILYLLCIALISYTAILMFLKPSNNRNWENDQKILPSAEISENLVHIKHIRDFEYSSTTSYVQKWYDKTYNLDHLKRVWYIVEPFSGIPGSAHTFLSFEFELGEIREFVSISVEIRKEVGEKFHPIKGLFNQYEIMYVIADEKDAVKLRSNFRKDDVYVYPVKANHGKAKALFVDMINRTNKLHDHPEFYNTLTNTCTTNIARHIRKISPGRIPYFAHEILFPALSDKLAFELNLIDTNLSFEEARKRFHINEKAEKYAHDSNFSIKIREE
ncbi:MAG: DUF4105 domain-containing protein [Candidatus Taylorbacteria bacterium]|nr:DUF4105 domain-containing protein [Candidatus Taylorbacteria bacterium]